MSSAIDSKTQPSIHNMTTVRTAAGKKINKAAALATASALVEALANAPTALASGCSSHTDVFTSPEGNRYAITSCSARAVKNVLASFSSNCAAKATSYSAAAPFWHVTREYGAGDVALGVEHYGVKDPVFQKCMDDHNASPIHQARIYDAKIAGFVIAGIACCVVGAGLAYGLYRCSSACIGSARRGLQAMQHQPQPAAPQNEAFDLETLNARPAPAYLG